VTEVMEETEVRRPFSVVDMTAMLHRPALPHKYLQISQVPTER
jgi:hypothetical protein